MTFCEIDNVNIVSHSGAVMGFVVVSKNGEVIEFPRCNLRDVRHQIVRNSFRIFADKPRLVRSDWVEIAQKHDIPRVRIVCFDVGGVKINENLLKHRFGLAVRIRAFSFRTFLGYRNKCRIAVNSRRRRENYVFAAGRAHRIKQNQSSVDVVFVINPRLYNRFSDSFETCKMNATVKTVF